MENESLFRSVDRLVSYGIACSLLPRSERIYATNLILDILGLDTYDGLFIRYEDEVKEDMEKDIDHTLQAILDPLTDHAVKKGLVEDLLPLRDIFDSRLMNALTPRPDTVIERFRRTYEISPSKATLDYYWFSKDTNYIRRDRIAKDEKWSGMTEYGELQILVSLSKPELDPKAIAAAREAKATGYPRCALCIENEGYAGRIDFAPRQNHRIIPFLLKGETFSLQFSPYRYCHQHCIVLNHRHIPMVIDQGAIEKLLEFVTLFPHYFLGSNADLPYVGGSVLSHEHFQGGCHRLPIMDAKAERTFLSTETIEVSSLHWPISTVRIRGRNISEVGNMASLFIEKWRNGYRDDQANIDPGTDKDPHNTVAPLAFRDKEDYVILLMLRNNRRTEERPDGLFHTHPSRFHIKKEGIGIIDAPGLAILPPRLKGELKTVKDILLGLTDLQSHPEVEKHSNWMEEIKARYNVMNAENIDSILKDEVVRVFKMMLEDCGVFKQDEQGRSSFARFISFVLEDHAHDL